MCLFVASRLVQLFTAIHGVSDYKKKNQMDRKGQFTESNKVNMKWKVNTSVDVTSDIRFYILNAVLRHLSL